MRPIPPHHPAIPPGDGVPVALRVLSIGQTTFLHYLIKPDFIGLGIYTTSHRWLPPEPAQNYRRVPLVCLLDVSLCTEITLGTLS